MPNTCLQMPDGGVCKSSEVMLSLGNSYYVQLCMDRVARSYSSAYQSNYSTQVVYQAVVRRVTDHAMVKVLNRKQQQLLEHYFKFKKIPETRFYQVKLGQTFTAHVKLTLPLSFVPSWKYAMIVYVYGAPATQVGPAHTTSRE